MSKHTLVDQYGKPLKIERKSGGMSAKYDAAQTTDENRQQWRGTDSLSGIAANSPDVRQKLRDRSRYECSNNGYAKGLVRGRADDTIGVCPRLQLSLPETTTDPDFQVGMKTPPGAARAIELLWGKHVDRIGLADKLRQMDKSETREGEIFGVHFSNPRLASYGGPRVDLRLYETDQCCTPDLDGSDPLAVDGIRFDEYGNPIEYHFLKQHPGDDRYGFLWNQEYERVSADRVYHLFDPERASEARGIPAITPSLHLYNQMREFTFAAIGAAKIAASIAGVIESDAPPDPGETPEIEAMDQIPFPRQTLLTMPRGAKAKAFDPAQPAPSYREFKGEIMTEAGRAVQAPRNISTGSSAEYNFSSGKLDRLGWEASIRIRRDRIRRILLDRFFFTWVAEAMLIPGYLPEGLPHVDLWRVKWRWDGFASIDPVKDATAAEIRLRSGVSTLERECAERGDDYEEVLEQRAVEGLPAPLATQATATPEEDEEVPINAD